MKRAIKNSGLYHYLAECGALASCNEQTIAQARKAYYREYKADWRQNNRKANKEFIVSFTPSELKVLTKAAQAHKRSRTRYIREACLAYAGKRYLVPDILAISQIREMLALNYTVLQTLFQENIVPYQTGIMLLQRMEQLERHVFTCLLQPPEQRHDISSPHTSEQ